MSAGNRLLFFFIAWLIVLMPFWFWWNTWFGRRLSDQALTEYLNDDKHPRHIQQALVQLGDRMSRHDPSAVGWYPRLLRLTSYPVEEVRNTDAWILGQDTAGPGFHEALLQMLQDPSPVVRGNAALSLVRFGDAKGHSQIVALLQPAEISSPATGRVVDVDKVGTSIRQGGLLAKIQDGAQLLEVRSPVSGSVRRISVEPGTSVSAGADLVTVDPAPEAVWEALRALYLIGQPQDLSAVRFYQRNSPDIPERIRQQATLTEQAILRRARQ